MTFIEDPPRDELRILDFDQEACAYLMLQMNRVQNIFDYQVVTLFPEDDFKIPKKKNGTSISAFDIEISRVKDSEKKYTNIDYWIGITSEVIEGNFFFRTASKHDNRSQRNIGIITSERWEKKFSPPSLFEYISLSVLTCSLYFLNYDFNGKLKAHKTKGCIFDYTMYKPSRRILVSNPNLCSTCKQGIKSLESKIQTSNLNPQLSTQIENILKKDWMGNLDERESPVYNLRKLYKYDIDHNSGFYKDWKEKFRESVSNKLAEWTVGNILGGIIGGIIVVIFFSLFKIKP